MKTIGMTLAVLLISAVAVAQPGMERMRAEKEKYFNEQLSLKEDQKEEFWLTYNEYQQKRRDIRIEISQNRLGLRKSEVSDQEARKILDNEMALKQKSLDLEKDYLRKFESILSYQQIITMYRAEDDFNRVVMQRLGKMRGGGGPGPDGPGKN